MPSKKTKTSRTGKRPNSKQFQFRWWMGVILVVIVAGVGFAILRFSQASGARNFYVDNGTIQPGGGASVQPATNGRERGFTASMNAINIQDGRFAQAEERFADIVAGYNPANVDKADIEVCFTYYRWATNGQAATFTTEILDWGGNQAAVNPGALYAPATARHCARQAVGSPDGNYKFFYKMVGTNSNGVAVVSAQRRTLAVYQRSTGGGPTTGPAPAPVPVDPNRQVLTFPAGTLTTTCGYRAVGGYALVCPEGNWDYIGLSDAWVGTWEQNRVRGATHEHDVGYWKWGNFCGVKSHITSEPRLDFQSGSHMYLVNCPTAQSVLNFKRQNAPRPIPKGTIYITKYGPNGPAIPNGIFRSDPNTVPGNTGVCVKNKKGETFACSGSNPIVLNGIFSNDSPYVVYTTPPSGWKLSRTQVSGGTQNYNGFWWGNEVTVQVKENQTSFVDLYFDRQ